MPTRSLAQTPLLPPGFTVPASRWIHPATRLRELLESEPYVFAPGIYDPHGAELAMYHRAKAIYFSGYSFAIGHLGTTDMDLYSGSEIADGARRTISALRKFQLTMATGDPEKGVPPTHLEIPPVVVDMDGGYGNIFNVQRTTELYVNAGVAAAHIEDQVLPKRCGHIGGKALIDLGLAPVITDDCQDDTEQFGKNSDVVSGTRFGSSTARSRDPRCYIQKSLLAQLSSGTSGRRTSQEQPYHSRSIKSGAVFGQRLACSIGWIIMRRLILDPPARSNL